MSTPTNPTPPVHPGNGPGSCVGFGTSKKIRVLVCDDSAFVRKALSQMINSDPALEVIDTARNGAEAVEKTKKLQPDVITLDIEMPVLNGHEALKRLKRECSVKDLGGVDGWPGPAVLVCSNLTSDGSHDALQAMREGAADIIAKDPFFSANVEAMRDDLVRKIKAIAKPWSSQSRAVPAPMAPSPWSSMGAKRLAERMASPRPPKELPAYAQVEPREMSLVGRQVRLIAIGSSTGGPPVLETILTQIPASLPCPIVVAQHMPLAFTKAMSERLDGMSAVSVVHGEHGMPLHPGTVYIIPGGQHGRVRAIGPGPIRLEVSPEPKAAPFRPSVNELLASAGELVGKQGVGIVLTGIGDDGKAGGIEFLNAGGLLLAQDPASSVVYGMPKAAAEIGGVIMTPDAMARAIASLVAPIHVPKVA